ncbi:hypothetical protein HHI36_020623 [Cryptolaemus montrouzieri]|uniref:Uncharacterized protein n=1 Tax=Cryptolaemus montrouzieri TaxID=559131 RepID=A0ABD2NAW3_9CUCU
MPVSDILKDNSNLNDSNIENEICSKISLTSDLLFRKENPQNLSEVTNIPQFSTASGRKIKIPPKSLLTVHQIFKDIPNMDNLKAGEVHDNYSKNSEFPQKDSNNLKCDERVKKEDTTPLRKIPLKKLGSTSRKNGKISETALNRAKSLFGDMNFDDLPKSVVNISGVGSPKFTSSTLIRPRKIETQHISSNFLSTPIKKSFSEKIDCLTDFHQEHTCPFLIQKPTGGDLASWIEELDRQKLVLEKKLALISEKQEVIKVQMNASSNINEVRSQPFIKKINKSNLRDVCNLALNSESISSVNNVILQINPQNAALIHFNGNWSDVAVVTIEGCTLVPNQQGFIGVSEVEPAFLSMPDIKSSLIPKGWIKNHYKWIVWKLASYERFFPSVLGGCFTIDSVIKQLKYRYCREIFHAQRPALRKIYELDDIPQKRMILCISNIFKNGNNIELELTDGWYSIRTIIDEPLCHQVNIKKIQIGFKLVISGAELIGCEGCHPLETQEAQKVRLKINFNATRRAAWFTRMGYQKNPMPFLIQLRGANDMGGMIGGVKMYVVRSYPLIFREKSEESTSDVWRNRNAEFRMVQEFENKCFNNYEEMSIGDKIGNVNSIRKRNVTAVFQMKVIDVLGDSSKLYKCTFWDATDFHVQQLEENQVILVYSLSLRSNYELSCNKKHVLRF